MADRGEIGAALTEVPMLGARSGTVLFELLTDLYRQEIGLEEEPLRTLPFFATALGFIGTLLSLAGTQLPSWSALRRTCGAYSDNPFSSTTFRCGGGIWAAVFFLALVVVLSLLTLFFLARATAPRAFRRIGPEDRLVATTRALHLYHQEHGLTGEALDEAVTLDVRSQLLDPLATTIIFNRKLTLSRYQSRFRALTCLLWSLFCALAGIISLILSTKFGTVN